MEKQVHLHGFVRLVDSMGNDASIVQAARVSYGDGTKTQREDEKLIDYLMRNRHTSPFEMVAFKFHVKLPIFVARQWIRHRTGSFNEVSARYSVLPEEFYIPNEEDITTQDVKNRQGRTVEQVADANAARFIIEQHSRMAYTTYQHLLEMGVARELARMVLPLNIYTEWYWQVNLKNLLDFLRLRLDPHAQKEFRDYGKAILKLIAPSVPVTIESWKRHYLNATAQ